MMGCVVTHSFVCRNPELIGEYIRTYIIERYVSFVHKFLERLSILSPTPEKIMKFLNGLTRRGNCLVNLTINSDIIRHCALKYVDAKVLCLIFRTQSSSIKTDKFYQLDDQVLQDKLFSIIEENEIYKTIQEIGNFLYRVGVEEGNYEFVKRFLNSVIKRYNNIENCYKIQYIIDSMTGKGMRTDVVIPLIQFLHDNLIPFGSIKTIIALWEVIIALLYENANDNAPVMAIIEQS
ncbi:unnamed protein product [Mytilus coruscus]|uniref:Uncharacterized protein n=1 Tax=Mytilus coruscus TaxID=42192 RepID=A0A6J8D0R6_MYTCO|nr:unnamed protein product [Mytilus coruscus]